MKHLFVAEDGTETIVNYTQQEIALAGQNKQIEASELAEQLAQAQAKATARQVILDRLGLTADEAALLLG
jgi:hypothetical protein